MSLPSLVALPPSLLPFVSRGEESFLAAAGNLSEALAARCRAWLAEHGEAFARVCAASDFVSEQVSRDPQMLLQLAELGWLDRSLEAGELRDALSELIAACDNEDTLALTLRRFRSRQQVRIIWRDLTRQAALAETRRARCQRRSGLSLALHPPLRAIRRAHRPAQRQSAAHGDSRHGQAGRT